MQRSSILFCVLLLIPLAGSLAQDGLAQNGESLPAGYRLGPNDVINIDVFGSEELDQRVRLLADGSASLPLLGRVEFNGLALDEAEARLEDLLRERDLVLEPDVSIFVVEFHSHGVSIQGAVQRPGVYQIVDRMTVIDLLARAGGLSGSLNQRAMPQIHVLRRGDGDETKFSIDAARLIDAGDTSVDIELQSGDVVVVPQERIYRIYVSGAVRRPGSVEFFASQGITALQAVTAAGGPTEQAGLSRVYVIHRTADGTEERTSVNLKKVRRGKESDIDLRPNDTLVVPEWFF